MLVLILARTRLSLRTYHLSTGYLLRGVLVLILARTRLSIKAYHFGTGRLLRGAVLLLARTLLGILTYNLVAVPPQ